MATGYTLKQLVSTVAPAADREALSRVARQVRHWTALDLLTTLTAKNTGTGVSRRYSADEVRKAAILVELSHYRIPAPVLEDGFETFTEQWRGRKPWQDAISGTKAVYFCLAYNEHIVTFQLMPAGGVISILQPKTRLDPEFDLVSAVVINLTGLFARLKF